MVFLVGNLAFHHHHVQPPSITRLYGFLIIFSLRCIEFFGKPHVELRPQIISIKWLQECFEVLPIVNQAFAKLVVEIDYPTTQWEVSCMEEYLNHNLSLSDSLNSITSALSQLSQARVSLSHALSVNENFSDEFKPLSKIMYKIFSNDLNMINGIGKSKRRSVRGKELVIHEALLVLKNIGSWVCSVVTTELCSDVEPYLKMTKSAEKCVLSPLITLDLIVDEKIVENKEIVKEMKAFSDAVECHVLAIANGKGADLAKELQEDLRRLRRLKQGLKEMTI